jgi:putative hydrolase of the HAD superfamily
MSPGSRAVLIDIGGVLAPDDLPAVTTAWCGRLGISPEAFLAALFGGSDDQVLIGRVSESAWWTVVAGRLGIDSGTTGEIRRSLAPPGPWDEVLLGHLAALRGRARTALVSNAWPHMRAQLWARGLEDIVDDVVLSCEAGYAKPDPRIYELALRRLDVAPASALFVDDTWEHVAAAQSLGLAGHVHVDSGGTIAAIERFLGPVTAGTA